MNVAAGSPHGETPRWSRRPQWEWVGDGRAASVTLNVMRWLSPLVLIVATLVLVAPQATPASAAPAPGARLIRVATELSITWGRCPTSRPAHRALQQARHARRAVRVRRAKRAVRAWRVVVRECSRPTPMPVARPES